MFRHVLRRYSSTSSPIETLRKVTFPSVPTTPPPTSPTVYVTDDEFAKYVKPLHWFRWSIVHFNRNLYLTPDGELRSGVFSSPYLQRTLHFRGVVGTKEFLRDLIEIVQSGSKEEGATHEPFVAIRPFGTSQESYRVAVFSGTHRCQDAPSLLNAEGTRVGPGISLHDARLAIVVERVFTDYVRAGRGFETPWKCRNIPRNVGDVKGRQRKADEALIRKEGGWYDAMTTPDLGGVTPLPIPEVPVEVGDEVCTDEEFARVIRPLYTRGWYMVYNNVTRKGGDGQVVLEKQPVLNGFFRFTSFEAAMGFSQEVLDLARVEKVGAMLWVDAQTVTVQGPAWDRGKGGGGGVMKVEARFAVLVEEKFVKEYGKWARASSVVGMKFLSQPESVESVKTHPAAQMANGPSRYMQRKWSRIVGASQRDSP
ncbi:hypothetical protein APHAL10511_006831 [Amanita phalloides]|nr:hypothetical protein APHAL10511_006831 [Amanita phalloides]